MPWGIPLAGLRTFPHSLPLCVIWCRFAEHNPLFARKGLGCCWSFVSIFLCKDANCYWLRCLRMPGFQEELGIHQGRDFLDALTRIGYRTLFFHSAYLEWLSLLNNRFFTFLIRNPIFPHLWITCLHTWLCSWPRKRLYCWLFRWSDRTNCIDCIVKRSSWINGLNYCFFNASPATALAAGSTRLAHTGSLSRSLATILDVGWFSASSRDNFGYERYTAGLVDIALSRKGLETYESTGSAGTTKGYGYGTEMDA